MKNPIHQRNYRQYVTAPLIIALERSGKDIEQVAAMIGANAWHLSDGIYASRDLSLPQYMKVASALDMELSLVPWHLARHAMTDTTPLSAVKSPATDRQCSSAGMGIAKVLLRLKKAAGISTETVSTSMGNAMNSFTAFQTGKGDGTMLSLHTIQKYASKFGLVLMAVPRGSVYRNSNMADHAKTDVVANFSTERNPQPSVSFDERLEKLMTGLNRENALNEAVHIGLVGDAASKLARLEMQEPQAPIKVIMPKGFAANLAARIDQVRKQGGKRIPYAEVVKPWGKPKSWAKYVSISSFNSFYGSMTAMIDPHDGKASARDLRSAVDNSIDVNMDRLFTSMQDQKLALAFEGKLPDGEKVRFAVRNVAELSAAVKGIIKGRNKSEIQLETKLSWATLDSLVNNPERNTISTLFRLTSRFGLKPTAIPEVKIFAFSKEMEEEGVEVQYRFGA